MADEQKPQNIDEETFFNQYKPNVSEEDFFNRYSPGLQGAQENAFQKGPYQGSMSDYFFGQTHVGKILSAFGEGAKEGWGANPGILPEEFKWEAEHKDEDHSILYGLHTSVMRPLASAMDTAVKGSYAAFGGFAGALGQTGENLSEYNKKDPYSLPGALGGPLGELAKEAASGALPDTGVHIPEYAHLAQEARMKAIIGEGEPGFYKTNKPSPEQIEARNQAAVNAGYGPETAQQWVDTDSVLPTPRELARQIDPDTFNEIDRLQDLKETSAAQARYARSQRTAPFEREEYTILSKVEGDESKLTEGEQRRLQNVRDLKEEANRPDEFELSLREKSLQADIGLRDIIPNQKSAEQRGQELLESQTPEGNAFRDLIQVQAFERAIQIENLRGRVQKAYRDASELLPVEDTKPKDPKSPLTKTVSKAQKILEADGPPSVKYKGNKEAGTSNKIEQEAVFKGVADYIGDKAVFESLQDQIPKAIDFVDNNYDQAKKIIQGKVPAPEGIHPVAIFNALKQEAYRQGDVEFIPDLARSPYNRVVSEAGQTLGMVRGMFDDLDPSNILKNVEDAWMNKKEKKIKKTVDEIKKFQEDAIRKFKPDYEAFLKSIECK